MRRRIQPYKFVGRIDLPEDLANDVLTLLRDPITGRTRYGELRKLTLILFSNWVELEKGKRSPKAPEGLTPL